MRTHSNTCKGERFFAPTVAAALIAVITLTSTANAGWLDVIKTVIGLPASQPTAAVASNAQPAAAPPAASSPSAPVKSATPAAPPTEEQILAAFDTLTAKCAEISKAGLPCGVAIGRGTTLANAQKVASTRSIAALGESMKAAVQANSEDILSQVEEDGSIAEKSIFNQAANVAVNAEVNGSQIFFTYSYITAEPKKTYNVMQLRVLNPALFEKALNSNAAGESLGKQLLEESLKGATDKIKNWYKNRK
ncbi:MAG: hypothetical protein LBB36_03480 [Fibromonadaceae bacterium]|jgi:hypothetical protein|nr:hypothetical protein [Fibromonadaceae bacterium]